MYKRQNQEPVVPRLVALLQQVHGIEDALVASPAVRVALYVELDRGRRQVRRRAVLVHQLVVDVVAVVAGHVVPALAGVDQVDDELVGDVAVVGHVAESGLAVGRSAPARVVGQADEGAPDPPAVRLVSGPEDLDLRVREAGRAVVEADLHAELVRAAVLAPFRCGVDVEVTAQREGDDVGVGEERQVDDLVLLVDAHPAARHLDGGDVGLVVPAVVGVLDLGDLDAHRDADASVVAELGVPDGKSVRVPEGFDTRPFRVRRLGVAGQGGCVHATLLGWGVRPGSLPARVKRERWKGSMSTRPQRGGIGRVQLLRWAVLAQRGLCRWWVAQRMMWMVVEGDV